MVEEGRLHLVPNAPEFSYPVYVVYGVNADHALLRKALAALREAAASNPRDAHKTRAKKKRRLSRR